MADERLLCLGLILGSYLLGSISSVILIGYIWTGKNIRKHGSPDANILDVARTLGLLPASLVAVMDLLKGAIPVVGAGLLGLGEVCGLAGSVAAVIGYSYPIFFHFRGVNGLVVSIGALLAFSPLETLLVMPFFIIVYLMVSGSLVSGAIVSLALLAGLEALYGHSWVIILAPLAHLLTLGLCAIPHMIYDWRQRENKKSLFAYWLAPIRQVPPGKTVAIVTDSLASLPAEICAREHIHIVPLMLILPDGNYRDGVDIEPRQYYRKLREEKLAPKTSAPSPGEFLKHIEELARTHSACVIITAPKELTQTWASARMAGEMLSSPFRVEIVDSRVAGPAEGFIAMAAARAANAHAPLKDILQVIELAQQNVGFIGVLDTVKFLAEGGRVPEANQLLNSVLRVYPVLSIIRGQIRLIGVARTKTHAIEKMTQWLKSTLKKHRVALAFSHTDAFQENAELERSLTGLFQPVESFQTELTPVIGAHAGPGMLGVAWWTIPADK
jgi:acyl-phosphate glycerol 3-phosphate acyltransferase